MDNASWHTLRKAAIQEGGEGEFLPSRSPNGRSHLAQPNGSARGGARSGVHAPSPALSAPLQNGHPVVSQPPPSLPENGSGSTGGEFGVRAPSPAPSVPLQNGHPVVRHPPPSRPGVADVQGIRPSFEQDPLSQLGPVERSRTLKLRKMMMDPPLQFVCGPLLRYDTVDEHGVWHGAALIVTADAESTYEPNPTLTCRWDPGSSSTFRRRPWAHGGADLGPHPADPVAQHYGRRVDDERLEGPNVRERRGLGTELYAYGEGSGTYTFWRFLFQIPLSDSEMKIQYSINGGMKMNFFVPGRCQAMRVAAYSCNGFSAYVNSDDFCGPGFQTGYDPVWVDLLVHHAEKPFHLLVGGGDQLYCDGVAREPEMQEWITHRSKKEKMSYRLKQGMLDAIDRFYFNHYCQSFRSGAFARANSSIPMLNMLDDHDLIDGFGSYPDELQKAPVFNTIGSRGYFFFLLFQCFINVDKDGTDGRSHPIKSTVHGVRGQYIPYPSHSILTPIGPTAWLLMLDCASTNSQVCSEGQYAKVFERLDALAQGVEHLIIQLGIPIVYPRLGILETMLSSKFNPLVTLAKSGSLGLKGFVNMFNGDVEWLDDLNDHWTSKHNMRERNSFIERLQKYALSRRVRISFLTGDVHCASVGLLKTLSNGKRSSAHTPTTDHRYMLNVVSSAIVNTPPPNGMLTLSHWLSTRRHREMHYANTDEEMIPLFTEDTDGSKPKSQYIMGRRNWCCITLQEGSGGLLFDIRVEKKKGHGETVGYCIEAPPPRWIPKTVE